MVRKFFGGDIIDCEIDKEKGQMLCRSFDKEKVDAAVLGQAEPGGGMSILKSKGNLKKIKMLKEYMADNVEIVKSKDSNDGEF